jgi:hypothetical protein
VRGASREEFVCEEVDEGVSRWMLESGALTIFRH